MRRLRKGKRGGCGGAQISDGEKGKRGFFFKRLSPKGWGWDSFLASGIPPPPPYFFFFLFFIVAIVVAADSPLLPFFVPPPLPSPSFQPDPKQCVQSDANY